MCNSDVRNVGGMKTFVFVFSQKVQSLSRKCDRKRNLVFFARNIFLIEILRENIFVLISLMVLKAEVTFTWLIQRLEAPAHPIPPPTPPIPQPPLQCKAVHTQAVFQAYFSETTWEDGGGRNVIWNMHAVYRLHMRQMASYICSRRSHIQGGP